MTVAELKDELLGKTYQTPIHIGPHAVVVSDVEKFLRVQFYECDHKGADAEKTPAYERLMKFYEATR
ncbi:DUF6965 family protein [Sphingobacterium sp. Mn56C]|uniref:DUF6965 family protein n=1 Tax=Sphingobacterium sp. Mn56C TaxID=3395261 RepID=UPI003BDB6C9E